MPVVMLSRLRIKIRSEIADHILWPSMLAVVQLRDFSKLGEQFVAMRIKLQGLRGERNITSSLVRGKVCIKFWPVRRA